MFVNWAIDADIDFIAHSFVRGNWRNSEESSPIIMQKSCHDMDILTWLVDSEAKRISSDADLEIARRQADARIRMVDAQAEVEIAKVSAQGIADSAKIIATGSADSVVIGAKSEAERIKLEGFAETDVYRARAMAEADGLKAKGGDYGMETDRIVGSALAENGITVVNVNVESADKWTCSCGKTGITSNFCPDCGTKKLAPATDWNCSCGAKGITSKFCPECGAKRP